ncbi:hypothetical protein J2Y48_003085 [Mycoplana sp. BE70]|uniref:DUF930 domain-containing protein n=1 Tax=Mycoplana sp. BE70 TaxID=2817775 RepID=UPI002865B6B5|nr:DUF930 domain-containing protein [Mycoplana sp. BE70]MDR6757788.1 hypothetical protein [Mycoplana sp. BE70]
MAERLRQRLGRGAIASIALHLLIAAILFVRFPLPDMTPPAEESVSVELVPPPEEKAAEEPPPEEKPIEEEKSAAPPEPPPPPEPQEAQAAELPADGVPIPVLRPVLEFGEKDAGPSPAEMTDLMRRKGVQPDAPSVNKPVEKPVEEPKPVPAEQEPEPEISAAAPAQDLNLPESDAADGFPAAPEEAEPDLGVKATMPEDASKADTADTAGQPEAPEQMTEATRLFSPSVTDDPMAQTAMGDLPRDLRVEQLCSTELYAQLRHASPPYQPQLLPSYRLSKGTVLEVRRAAFYAKSRWFDLRFRCEVDADATRVISFAFAVGDEIPKREWKKRGFPSL